MGKQINFFMLRNKELEFLKEITKNGDFLVDDKLNPVSEEIIKKDIIYDKKEMIEIPLLQVFIVSPDSKIFKMDNGYIDTFSSEVIEFFRSAIIDRENEKEIVDVGRLWAEFTYYSGEEKIRKEKYFEQKFESYRKWIKKHLNISKTKEFYIDEEAYNLYKKGYKMQLSPKYNEEFE